MPTASLSSSSASILISSSLASPILSLNNYQTNTFCSIAITRFITLFQHIHSSKVPDKDTHTHRCIKMGDMSQIHWVN